MEAKVAKAAAPTTKDTKLGKSAQPSPPTQDYNLSPPFLNKISYLSKKVLWGDVQVYFDLILTTCFFWRVVTIDKAAEYFLKNVLSNPEKPPTA